MTYHSHLSILVLCLLRHPRLPLFPYTTLFRSRFTGGAVVESDSPAEALHGRQASHLRLFGYTRSEEHTSELQSHLKLVCRLLLEKKNNNTCDYRLWLDSIGVLCRGDRCRP